MLVKNANPPLTANELSNKIKFDTPQKLSEHVIKTPLGIQAQKYIVLWAEQGHEAKLVNEQIKFNE